MRTVETFEDTRVDYLPAVCAVRDALDEPRSYEKPRFTSISTLDKWIKKREKVLR